MPEEKINKETPSHTMGNLIQRITVLENIIFASKEVLNLEEAAIFMGISRSTLYKMTHTNALPFFRPNGKLIYFEKSELLKWMRNNRVLSKEEINENAHALLQNMACQ